MRFTSDVSFGVSYLGPLVPFPGLVLFHFLLSFHGMPVIPRKPSCLWAQKMKMAVVIHFIHRFIHSTQSAPVDSTSKPS